MLNSLKRNKQVRQIGQVELNISVDGTATTPSASGPDANIVSSITDNGTGDYTITLAEPSKMNLHVSSIVLSTADASIIVFSVDKSTVRVKAKSVAGSPAAKDVDFSIQILFMDQLAQYF